MNGKPVTDADLADFAAALYEARDTSAARHAAHQRRAALIAAEDEKLFYAVKADEFAQEKLRDVTRRITGLDPLKILNHANAVRQR